MNEKTIHTGRNVRRSGLAAKQHSSVVCAGGAGMFGSVSKIIESEPMSLQDLERYGNWYER